VCSSYGMCLHVSLPYLTVWEVSYASLPPSSYRILAPRSVTESYGVFCVHSSLTVSSVTVLLRKELLGYGPYGVSTVFLLSLRYSSS
jgi:hypothetical protein